MSKDEYEETMTRIAVFAYTVQSLPLTEFLSAIDHADNIGPILNPTLWRDGQENMHKIRQVAEALKRFQSVVAEVASP